MSDFGDSLASLVARVTAPDPPSAKVLLNTLNGIAKRDNSDTMLKGLLPDGQDPLQVVSPSASTLTYLFILLTRLTASGGAPVHSNYITSFCQSFEPADARLVPERVTKLAQAIFKFSEQVGNPRLAVEPLFDLVTRYPPSLSYLTTIHPIFLKTCVLNRQFTAAIPVLSVPITEIDKTISDLEYQDNLVYHYLGGITFGALGRYAEAEEFLEIVVSSPVAQTPSAVQLEAYKKLILIQLIQHGKTIPVPKYTSAGLTRQLKNINQYSALVKIYPSTRSTLQAHIDHNAQFFSNEGNLGLMKIVVERSPRWALKQLGETYTTLSLAQVAQYVHLPSPDAVRTLVLDMIERDQFNATLSPDGTLTFLPDAAPDVAALGGPAAVESMLRDAQDAGRVLTELNLAMTRSRELLSKAVKDHGPGSERHAGMGPAFDDEADMWTGRSRGNELFDD